MRRCHVGKARLWRAVLAGDAIQSLRIDGYRNQRRPGGLKSRTRTGVAGILHPHRIARIEQHLSDQADRLLGSIDDRICSGVQVTAREGRDTGQRFAQWLVAPWPLIAEQCEIPLVQDLARQSRPECEGKAIERRSATAKWAWQTRIAIRSSHGG